MSKRFIYRLSIVVLCFTVCIILLCGYFFGSGVYTASAESVVFEDTVLGDNEFDSSNVLDDLESSEIDGVPFSLNNYPFLTKGSLDVLAVSEYCYTYDEYQFGNYGIYVYVYNPADLDIDTDSGFNTISIQFGLNSCSSFYKLPLLFCNKSYGESYNLFYKFRVDLSSSMKSTVLELLDSSQRDYTVSDVTLRLNGSSSSESIYVSTTYSFAGYAAHYGANHSSISTLVTVATQSDSIVLDDVGTCFYRPAGANNSSFPYLHDSLHSVYFAIPNYFVNTYGSLVGLSAEWTDAVLTPSLVLGDSDDYNLLNQFLGVNYYEAPVDYTWGGIMKKHSSSATETYEKQQAAFKDAENVAYFATQKDFNNYHYRTNIMHKTPVSLMGFCPYNVDLYYDKTCFDNAGQNYYTGFYDDDGEYVDMIYGCINPLYFLYLAPEDGTVNNADNYILSSEEINDNMLSLTDRFYSGMHDNDDSVYLVEDRYLSSLFSDVADEKTYYQIDSREGMLGYENYYVSLLDNSFEMNWWQRNMNPNIWKYKVSSNSFDDVRCLVTLNDGDFDKSYTDSYNANRLYVDESEYNDLKDYYDKYSSMSYNGFDDSGYSVVVLRYQVSDYYSIEASCWDVSKHKYTNSNAYFFQETVNLGFDIIDATFCNGTVDTVIGVCMEPIDVVSSATPPTETTDDSAVPLWKKIVFWVCLVLGIIILIILLPWIVKFLIWLFKQPVKFCKWCSKKNKERKERKQEKQAEKAAEKSGKGSDSGGTSSKTSSSKSSSGSSKNKSSSGNKSEPLRTVYRPPSDHKTSSYAVSLNDSGKKNGNSK